METLWKVVEELIDTCLRASLQMQDILHRFRDRRGTGTAIMELNIAQDLAVIDQDPLLLVLLDFWKVYDTVDRDHLRIILYGYGAGPWMCGLLENFWELQQMVPRQNGFHGPVFPVTRGKTQG